MSADVLLCRTGEMKFGLILHTALATYAVMRTDGGFAVGRKRQMRKQGRLFVCLLFIRHFMSSDG